MQHHFNTSLHWHIKANNTDKHTKVYQKNHEIVFTGKQTLNISAAKAFKGDPSLLNPEDLLLASITSCHMMSYLYCCQQHQIEVIDYKDESEAILETYSNGSGKITKVILKPIITIKNADKVDLATALHKKANELCFIANSTNFEVQHIPKIILES